MKNLNQDWIVWAAVLLGAWGMVTWLKKEGQRVTTKATAAPLGLPSNIGSSQPMPFEGYRSPGGKQPVGVPLADLSIWG
jgi:hypothetical protein